jgi:thiol-disulfide isomerase/thioredoxin
VTQLAAFHGEIHKSIMFLADGSPDEARIHLPEANRFPDNIAAMAARPPAPPAIGQPAPELQVGPWSDHRAHQLADERGTVVVLYFWGMPFQPSLWVMPAVGKLAKEYEPRGVRFLAIHNHMPDQKQVEAQAGKALAFAGAPLIFAIDQARVASHARGLTADRYGQKTAPPFLLVIDRAGKIAFHSETANGDGNVGAVARQLFSNPSGMTEDQANERIERALGQEIERVLKQND